MSLPMIGAISGPVPSLDERLRWLLNTARALGVEIDTIRVNSEELWERHNRALNESPHYNPRVGDPISFEGCTLLEDMRIRRIDR